MNFTKNGHYFYCLILISMYIIYYVNSRRNVDSGKSEPQMEFEPTTLRDLVGCSNHRVSSSSVVRACD